MDKSQISSLKASHSAMVRTWRDFQHMLEAPVTCERDRQLANLRYAILIKEMHDTETAFTRSVTDCARCLAPDVLSDLIRCAGPCRSY
jgi:hypothetical protein